MIRSRLCVAPILAIFSLSPNPGNTQDTGPLWKDPEWLKAKTVQSIFHLDVLGTLKGGAADEEHRVGKAFSIGPNLLITAHHNIGDAAEWEVTPGTQKEVARATNLLQRKLSLRRPTNAPAEYPLDEIVVLPPPSYALDVAGLSIPKAGFSEYFRLSLCEIVDSEQYAALMTKSDDPATDASVDDISVVELVPRGYEPASYGGLYVFDTKGDPVFSGDPDGHDGSPIVDKEGNVAAIVSAVTTVTGKHRILATPIQPMSPGAIALVARPASNDVATGSLKCSLSEAVKRLNDDVAAHAVWDVAVDYGTDNLPTKVTLKYEGTLERPNIVSVKLLYDYMGKQVGHFREIKRIAFDGASDNLLELNRNVDDLSKEFDISSLIAKGINAAYNLKKRGGFIDSVEITIMEIQLDDGRTLNKEVVLSFDWERGS